MQPADWKMLPDEIQLVLSREAMRRAADTLAEHAEMLLRIGLKSQSQCRATLETLAQIKNPPIVYAKQANITNGPQQYFMLTFAYYPRKFGKKGGEGLRD